MSIGCVCRAKGGLALQGLLPTGVETLIAVARSTGGLVAFWAVHGLWLTANAAGLSFISHVKVGLAVRLEDVLLCFLASKRNKGNQNKDSFTELAGKR